MILCRVKYVCGKVINQDLYLYIFFIFCKKKVERKHCSCSHNWVYVLDNFKLESMKSGLLYMVKQIVNVPLNSVYRHK